MYGNYPATDRGEQFTNVGIGKCFLLLVSTLVTQLLRVNSTTASLYYVKNTINLEPGMQKYS